MKYFSIPAILFIVSFTLVFAVIGVIHVTQDLIGSDCQDGAYYTAADCFTDDHNNQLCVDFIYKCVDGDFQRSNRIYDFIYNEKSERSDSEVGN